MQQYWHKYNFMQAISVTKLTAFKVMFAIFPTGEVMLEGIIWTEFQWSNKAFVIKNIWILISIFYYYLVGFFTLWKETVYI